jgi:alkaline phosphatase D
VSTKNKAKHRGIARRRFLVSSSALASTAVMQLGCVRRVLGAPALIAADSARPQLAQGIQLGDVLQDRAMIWTRSDRPARMVVEWSTRADFQAPRRVIGPHLLPESDHTGRIDLLDLPAGAEIFVRAYAQGLDSARSLSAPVAGRFITAPAGVSNVRFVWSGDTAGQGYGINPDFGGMRMYETMRQRAPQFFIHSGDTIYADGPIPEQIVLTNEGDKVWRNVVTPEKSKVAETLDELRGNYRYNLLDDNVRRFNAEVPQIWQWDDHEVVNNWSPGKVLDERYTVKDIPLLVARATRAFLEYAPLRRHTDEESERVYRHIPYGPLLDVFVIDMRSYRGPNTFNRQELPNDETTLLDSPQLHWLKRSLLESDKTWKVIASDMPLGLLVRDGDDEQGRPRFENAANGNGQPLGRELELKSLLQFIKRNRITNVVWLTADVHYCAAHYYDPSKAQFGDFDGFWEFVSGPINAGSFGPSDLDDTFGPQVVFQKAPPVQNLSPYAGYQFFGQVDIDARSRELSVSLVDIDGNTLFSKTLSPVPGHRGHDGARHCDEHR